MTSDAKTRLQKLSQHLSPSPSSPPSSPPIPRIQRIAPDPSEPSALSQKICILTGCSSPTGIGLATAHTLAALGARALYLCDKTPTHLSAHASDLHSLHPKTKTHSRVFDAADEAAVKAVVQEALDTYGRLDVFFANAGISGPVRRMEEQEEGEVMEVLRVNCLGVVWAVKYAGPAMGVVGGGGERGEKGGEKVNPGGSIVATASVAALRSNAGPAPYSASKAAVVSLVQTAAWQFSGTGVRVNAVCPGLIETGMTGPMFEAARRRGTEGRIGQLNPLRRGGVADEVGRVVAFLAGEGASYVTGQAWAVDGGLSSGLPVVGGKLA